MDTSEQAVQTRLHTVNLLLHLLDNVIREARDAGDDRWKAVSEQAQALNDERAQLLRQLREIRGESEPPPRRIEAVAGSTRGQSMNTGGTNG